eukprot:CAMPEP_0168191924 /NCGR_PEP_ID=MMETSP0139_2-20121125/17775_1 /TAXON_ID=44445 /ORGANISM="Pseudo-nitzschia australis, Strain 10249 10 AB" /LENGTH=474 /DNA_ID=CAMNT_0008115131 /DNA_START=528 /DNA_END=1952 /DNA_ORIENTATION=+
MSPVDTFYDGDEEEEWEKVLVPIPLSVEEGYEIVLPTSNFPATNNNNDNDKDAALSAARSSSTDAAPSTARSSSNTGSSILQRIKDWHHQLSLQRNQLGLSITKTFAELSNEDPSQMEKDFIQRAMELSMLDVALVHYHHGHRHSSNHIQQEQKLLPHNILGVAENANPAEIKSAYRKLARLHHPDKGGEPHRFEEIARAYRSMLSSGCLSTSMIEANDSVKKMRLTTAACDKELQDHRRLVNDLFQADGMDLQACVAKQLTALNMLGLAFKDAGAINRNERNEIIHNSCFYLSLATSYLWGIGALSFNNNGEANSSGSDDGNNELSSSFNTNCLDAKEEDQLLVGDTALQLKRTIEAAVVKAHPEWVLEGKVGEEVQAFSDFLVYTLDSYTQLSELAVVVFDSTSGFCDIYKGQNYDNRNLSLQSNTITLRYIPGHYQPLIPSGAFARRPALKDIINALDDLGVFYVITDGNS